MAATRPTTIKGHILADARQEMKLWKGLFDLTCCLFRTALKICEIALGMIPRLEYERSPEDMV